MYPVKLRTKAMKASIERARRVKDRKERRFTKPLKHFIERKYPEIMSEYIIFYGYMDFKEPERKDLTYTTAFRKWLADNPLPSRTHAEIVRNDMLNVLRPLCVCEQRCTALAKALSSEDPAEVATCQEMDSSEDPAEVATCQEMDSSEDPAEVATCQEMDSSEVAEILVSEALGCERSQEFTPTAEEKAIFNELLEDAAINEILESLFKASPFDGVVDQFEPFDFTEVNFDFSEV